MPQCGEYPTRESYRRATNMTMRAVAPVTRTPSDPRQAMDNRFEPVRPIQMASSPDSVRVPIANQATCRFVRHGLWDVIAREPDLQVVGETDDGGQAIVLARQLRPNVVLIDLSMSTVDGIAATRIMRMELPATQVVVMTGADVGVSVIEAIQAGAAAYLLKDARIHDLLRAIRGVERGQIALPAQTAARMIRQASEHSVLSHRESEVLKLIAQGLSNKEVARELNVTPSTVKAHVSGILSKLGLPSRIQLAPYAVRTGLVVVDRLGSENNVRGAEALW
jgi:NarL family two-component system response regulator LiaR